MADCASIDSLVTPYLDGELPLAARTAVDEHLRRCGPCRSRVDAERVARDLVRAQKTSFQAERAPDGLRRRCGMLSMTLGAASDRVREVSPAGASRGPLALWRSRLAPLALAAGLVILVGGAFLSRAADGSARVLAAELAADHVKCFALDDVLGTRETPSAVQSAMLSGFGWHMNVANQTEHADENGSLDLIGARRCLYTHGLIAHLMYRHEGAPVSIFMLPKTARTESLVEVLGHQAAIWSVDDHTFVLIARGSRAEVQRMATYAKTVLH